MANIRFSDTVRDALMNELDAQCNADTPPCLIRIYSGTQPATADTALSGNTLLATLTCSNPAFGASSNGVITLSSVTDDSSADATGTASFARIVTGTAFNTVFDCDVGTSGATINLNTVSIVSGGVVSITSGSITFADS